MNAEKRQENWYEILDSKGLGTGNYVFASNIQEAKKKFKTDECYKQLYRKYGYFGKLQRVYNGGVRG